MQLNIKKLNPDATMPIYATPGASCFDLTVDSHAWGSNAKANGVIINPGETVLFGTGLVFEIPEGWGINTYSRSGHGVKHNLVLANGTGIIDSDYVGELKVALRNEGRRGYVVRPGDRIAQGMLVPILQASFNQVEQIKVTERGDGGLGSTESKVAA